MTNGMHPTIPDPRPEDLVSPEILERIDRFGGEWTRAKLKAVSHYLRGYTKALYKNPHFQRYYIDAFAGTGICRLKRIHEPPSLEESFFAVTDSAEDAESDVIAGSALRAMCVKPQFTHHYFIEESAERAGILEGICSTVLRDQHRYDVIVGDANLELIRLINSIDWRRHPYPRAAVFLDPYAVNVEWGTLRTLFATRAVDVWYLINTATIQRLLRRDPTAMSETSKQTLDRIFGTRDWETVVYQEPDDDEQSFGEQLSLFETTDPPHAGLEKRLPMRALASFIAQRARSDLGAWVYPKALPLRNSKKAVAFCLMFMMANTDAKATGLASNLVNGIFTQQEGFDLVL